MKKAQLSCEESLLLLLHKAQAPFPALTVKGRTPSVTRAARDPGLLSVHPHVWRVLIEIHVDTQSKNKSL